MHLGGTKFRAGVFFIVSLLSVISALGNDGSLPLWRQYGFDARHNLFNSSENILNRSNVSSLSLKWEYMTGNGEAIAPLAGPALADGVLYVPAMAATTFTALDVETGTPRWIYTGISTFSDPAIANGYVYTASLDGNLYAFSTSCSGTCKPTLTIPVGKQGTNSPPTFSNKKIYIGGYDGRVYAFDAMTGREIWSAPVNPPRIDPLNWTPAVSGDHVYVSSDRGIYAFPTDCSGGCKPLWISKTKYAPSASPTLADNFVLVADYQGEVYAFDSITGALQWEGRVTAPSYKMAAAHGVAYVTTGKGELAAFAVAGCGETQCEPLWTSAPSGFSLFVPTIANGVVYVGALDFVYLQGDIVAYPTTCTDGCQPIATLVLGGANETSVVVAGGRVYATTVNGNVDSFSLAQ